MTEEFILANASLVLPTETVTGSLALRDGMIAAIDQGAAVTRGAIDCGGDYVAPGLIELHTDNLERHIRPRPKVDWPHKPAILAHDAELAGVGITTVFDAIRVGSVQSGKRSNLARYARTLATEILSMRAAGALKISHHLHLRAEVCSETLTEELQEFGPEDRVGIVSLMDHTPGQRQWADLGQYYTYLSGKYGVTQTGFDAYIAELQSLSARVRAPHQAAAVAAARHYGATLASHDDTTADQVAASAAHGVTLAEFPTTAEAAQACRASGIGVIMGAPNLVRGASHSGNVAAGDLAREGLLDILSSDYVPAALLLGAVQLGRLWGDMARGLATVTAAPARYAHQHDRGELAIGKRADLIRFGLAGDVPSLRAVWSHGARVG